jgi:hypothetical protein
MRRASIFRPIAATLVLTACGDDPPPPAPTPAASAPAAAPSAPKPAASAAPAASAVASSTAPGADSASVAGSAAVAGSASAAGSSVPLPVGSAGAPPGTRSWADFAGPEVKVEFAAGAKAWAVLPVSAGWATLRFARLDVKGLEGTQVVFSVSSASGGDGYDVLVPGAFTSPATAAEGLAKDDPVVVATSGTRAFGRVVSVDGAKAKVRYRFAGTEEEREVPTTDLIKLDGTLKFGAPVAYSEPKENPKGPVTKSWHPAQFVQGTEGKTWVVTAAGKPLHVPADTVRALDVRAPRKAGDAVWAAPNDELLAATITEPLDGGLRFKVKLASGEDTTVSYEAVSSPLR